MLDLILENPVISALIAIAVILLIIGLFKRTLGLCIAAIVLGALLFISQPSVWDNVTDSVTSIFDGSVEPLENEDYSDVVEELDNN